MAATTTRTRAELEERGYRLLNRAQCSSCGTAVEWWQTPFGKRVPLLPMPAAAEPAVPHLSESCIGLRLF